MAQQEYQEDRVSIEAQLREAQETIRKPFLRLSQLRKGGSIDVKMVGPRYGKAQTLTFGKDISSMTPEEQKELETFYIYDLMVARSDSEFIDESIVYEYSCPKSYYRDVWKETDLGEKRLIKGLRSMFMEGHRTFKISKVHEGKSTQFRNYMFTPLDRPDSSLAYS